MPFNKNHPVIKATIYFYTLLLSLYFQFQSSQNVCTAISRIVIFGKC